MFISRRKFDLKQLWGRPSLTEPFTNETGTKLMKFTAMQFTREGGLRGCNVAVTRETAKQKILRGGDLTFLVGEGTSVLTVASLKGYTEHPASN